VLILSGIGHGDIKPDNILVEEDADGNLRALLTDFGAAIILGQERQPFGTKLWNAPELRIGKLNHAFAEDIMAADLYSFGLLAAHILIPNDELTRADIFLIQPKEHTSQVLSVLKKEERLIETLTDIARASGIPQNNQILLRTILESTLLMNTSDRTLPLDQISYLIHDYLSPKYD
jgi:serine/threonine protein kinase